MFTKRFSLLSRNSLSAVCVVLAVSAVPAGFARADDEPTLFVESAVEHPDNTVTLPLYLGVSDGRPVWFVILDASDGKDAARLGVNQASKLANARDTGAVQHVTMADGVVEFTATVDFTPERIVTPGPGGFPPQQPTAPGAVGEAGYSPLVQMPDGRVLNAPHVANDSGIADKVVAIDFDGRTVRILETDGFSGGKAVRYVSTDASDPVVAALEGVTYAPALAAAPSAGADGTDSARARVTATRRLPSTRGLPNNRRSVCASDSASTKPSKRGTPCPSASTAQEADAPRRPGCGSGSPRMARACRANSEYSCEIRVTMPVSCGRGLTSLNHTSSPRTNSSTPNRPQPPSASVIAPAMRWASASAAPLIGCGCQLSR